MRELCDRGPNRAAGQRLNTRYKGGEISNVTLHSCCRLRVVRARFDPFGFCLRAGRPGIDQPAGVCGRRDGLCVRAGSLLRGLHGRLPNVPRLHGRRLLGKLALRRLVWLSLRLRLRLLRFPVLPLLPDVPPLCLLPTDARVLLLQAVPSLPRPHAAVARDPVGRRSAQPLLEPSLPGDLRVVRKGRSVAAFHPDAGDPPQIARPRTSNYWSLHCQRSPGPPRAIIGNAKINKPGPTGRPRAFSESRFGRLFPRGTRAKVPKWFSHYATLMWQKSVAKVSSGVTDLFPGRGSCETPLGCRLPIGDARTNLTAPFNY